MSIEGEQIINGLKEISRHKKGEINCYKVTVSFTKESNRVEVKSRKSSQNIK